MKSARRKSLTQSSGIPADEPMEPQIYLHVDQESSCDAVAGRRRGERQQGLILSELGRKRESAFGATQRNSNWDATKLFHRYICDLPGFCLNMLTVAQNLHLSICNESAESPPLAPSRIAAKLDTTLILASCMPQRVFPWPVFLTRPTTVSHLDDKAVLP